MGDAACGAVARAHDVEGELLLVEHRGVHDLVDALAVVVELLVDARERAHAKAVVLAAIGRIADGGDADVVAVVPEVVVQGLGAAEIDAVPRGAARQVFKPPLEHGGGDACEIVVLDLHQQRAAAVHRHVRPLGR